MSGAKFTAIGIDVGGTKIAAGVVRFPSGEIHHSRRIPSTTGDRPVGLDVVCELVQGLAAEARASHGRIDAIGFGLCEIVPRDGTIGSGAMFKWSEREVKQGLSSIAPVMIEADVRAAARAEAMFGEGRNLDCFLYVSIGTGISCSLVIDGEPFLGARGATGTMGSGPLPAFDSTSPLSLEQIASGHGLRERFNRLGNNIASAEEVLAAADAGNAKARKLVETGARALGASIGWLVNVLDPAAVVLGGGLGIREGFFRETLVEAARQHIWWENHRNLPILTAGTKGDAGVIGAAAAAWIQASHSITKKPRSRPRSGQYRDPARFRK